ALRAATEADRPPALAGTLLGLFHFRLRVSSRRLGLPSRERVRLEEVEHDSDGIETWTGRLVGGGTLPGGRRRVERGGSCPEHNPPPARRAEGGGRPQHRDAADRG